MDFPPRVGGWANTNEEEDKRSEQHGPTATELAIRRVRRLRISRPLVRSVPGALQHARFTLQLVDLVQSVVQVRLSSSLIATLTTLRVHCCRRRWHDQRRLPRRVGKLAASLSQTQHRPPQALSH